MPSRCVAAGCSNCPSETVSVFKFPKDVKLRDIWTKQVQRTRAKWMPTSSSVLCSEHFERHCFNEIPQLKASLGFVVQHKRVLIPSAVPSIFVRSAEKPDKKTRKSKAAEKLATKREVSSLLKVAQPAATTSTCDQSQAPADCEAVSSEVQSTETSLQPCTRRHVRVQVSQTKLGTLKHKVQ
uniref:THAP domain-containing protein 10-like n=1 Tax=Myxine glutinosa TaxID=7769 RepID=UPI0035900BE7